MGHKLEVQSSTKCQGKVRYAMCIIRRWTNELITMVTAKGIWNAITLSHNESQKSSDNSELELD